MLSLEWVRMGRASALEGHRNGELVVRFSSFGLPEDLARSVLTRVFLEWCKSGASSANA